MPLKIVNTLPPTKRRINGEIDGFWEDEHGNFIIRELTEEEEKQFDGLDQLEKEYHDFRVGAPSTIEKQDIALRDFRVAMRFRYPRTGRALRSLKDESLNVDQILNEAPATLTKDIIWWIEHWMQRNKTRGLRDTRPKIGTAAAMRSNIIFWLKTKRFEYINFSKLG
jgi:hypothetical protein